MFIYFVYCILNRCASFTRECHGAAALQAQTTSIYESKDPDVFWLPVRLLVKVEFAVYSLSFELMFMNDNI
jgi:hypothetical protein